MIESKRIEVVDALRGFAILAIVLLHNMEHFEYNQVSDALPAWLLAIDKHVVTIMYFLFGGKAYAIFALIFGFSFYIQANNQKKLGNDYSLRFTWRQFLLLIFGFINTAFYQGDILTLYAIFGLCLIPINYLSDRAVFVIALICMLQPYEWFVVINSIANSSYVALPNYSEGYYKSIAAYMQSGNFIDYVKGNVTLGKAASLLWSWENGRFFQAPALFMLGLLAGRKQLFTNTPEHISFWKKILKFAIPSFLALLLISIYFPDLFTNKVTQSHLKVILNSWANFALMLIWVAGFILLFYSAKANNLLSKLIPFGKMGLTNYIVQSIIGSTLYYRYGFSLYRYTGAIIAICIGFMLFLLQLELCKWWLKTHKQGPLEYVWHKLTWIKLK
jgi:uncharacterized protein